jgi:hypothetical protein
MVSLSFSRDGGAGGKLTVGPFLFAYLTGRELWAQQGPKPAWVLAVREGRLWRVQGQQGEFGTAQFTATPQP